jgi:predicted transposase/invertase (TIGR01784 family)
MPDPTIWGSHDRYARSVFSRLELSRRLFEEHLPASVVEAIDLETLEPAKDSYVDTDLRASYSDLAFTARLRGSAEALIYLLFEHKSSPDPLTPFQLLRYIVRIWESRLREGKDLCCVIPFVFHHGRTGWTAARQVWDLVAVPESLKRYVPNMQLEILDLDAHPDDDLARDLHLRTNLLLLKYAQRAELGEHLAAICRQMAGWLGEPDGRSRIQAALNYIASCTDQISASQLSSAIENEIRDRSIQMPTIVEQRYLEGIQQGKQQGIQEGMQQGIQEGKTAGLAEGIQQGRTQGQWIGQIQTLQELLGQPVSSTDELAARSITELAELAAALKVAVRGNGKD